MTLQNRIVTSIRNNIHLLNTYSLTDFQTAVILRRGENLSQNFILASHLFIAQPFVTISNYSRLRFQFKKCQPFRVQVLIVHNISELP